MFGARNFFLTAARAAFDPLFDYVTLLLTGNGTNGAQNNTFLDSSTNNFAITRNGNTTQGTFTPFGPNWSNYFDGSTAWLTASASSSLALSGNFTVEFWLYYTGTATNLTPGILTDSGTGAISTFELNNGSTYLQIAGISATNTVNRTTLTGGAIGPNQWYHLAFVRNSNVITAYINGVAVSTTMTNSVTTGQLVQVGNGRSASPSVSFLGYLSNYRIVSSAVYTSNFTPSTAPLTAITGTQMLTCQGNRFVDNSSNALTFTVNGSPSVQRFSPFNPTVPYAAGTIGGSGYFDAVNDTLTTATSANLNVGTGAFQIDFWMYTTASPGQYMGPFGTNNAGGTGGIFFANRGGNLDFTNNFDTAGAISGPFPRLNEWHHIVVVRNSSNVRAYYVDGVRVGALSNAVDFNQTQFTIGAYNASFGGWTGYISNFRVIVGSNIVDPNSTTISVPTSPTTAVAGTQLLLNFINGGIIDNAMMNDLETVGNAQISTSVSKFGGGSLAFDGTGDYLTIPNSQNFVFNAGNWTVECWVYLNATGRQGFVALGNGSGTNIPWELGLNASNKFRALVQTSAGQVVIDGTTTPSTATWYHLAAVRNGSTVTLYVNGTSEATGSVSTNSLVSETNVVNVGQYSYGFQMNGYIDDLRITKGYARYTANFTPPAAPFSLQ